MYVINLKVTYFCQKKLRAYTLVFPLERLIMKKFNYLTCAGCTNFLLSSIVSFIHKSMLPDA